MKRNQQDLTSGPLLSGIIAYTVPIILTSVLQLLFNAADLVVVGRFRGSLAVGAVGATGSITNLIVNLFVGLSIGAGRRCLPDGHRRFPVEHLPAPDGYTCRDPAAGLPIYADLLLRYALQSGV